MTIHIQQYCTLEFNKIMNKDSKIYVAGHTGLVGSAIVRQLKQFGYHNLLLRTREELNLLWRDDVDTFFQECEPEYVFLCAAKVGGVLSNSLQQADFLWENQAISSNIIIASRAFGVKRLLNLGSVCIYPRETPQPIKEEYLLTNTLEPTNEGYAIAKIAALKLCQKFNEQYNTDFMSVMPCNLYGIGDRSTHVIPDLVRKFHTAKIHRHKQVILYGTGQAKREFLYADDFAEVCVRIMTCGSVTQYTGGILNIGSGAAIPISALADIIKEIVEYTGEISYDSSKPDGAPIRLLDCTRLQQVVDWKPKVKLEDGIRQYYEWFKNER